MPIASCCQLSRTWNSSLNRFDRSVSNVSSFSVPLARLSTRSWISRMVIFSHRSDRRMGQTRLGLTRCGASLERLTRIMMAPASPCVSMWMISIPGMCGSTQSRNINPRRFAKSAQRGMGEILLATPGPFSDFSSSMPSMRAPPKAFAKATDSSRILLFAFLPRFPLSYQESSCPFSADKSLLNSIRSSSCTRESINAFRSSTSNW